MTSRCSPKPNLEEDSTPVQSQGPILKHTFGGHKEAIRALVFLHDDVHIVSGSEDGTMSKWSCDTGLVIGEPWKGEGGGIYALALTPDGRIIGCGREDGSIQLWNTNGKMIRGVWTGHHSRVVRTLSWSPNGTQLASGSDDGTILIREREIRNMSIKTDQIGVQVLAYSPSGERIASGGYNTICIWNAKTAKLVVGPIKSQGAYVTSLVWSSDSTKFYFASDGFARVFDSKSGKLLHRFEHDRVLWSVALSPKHNVLACVGNDGIAQLWDTESHQQLGQPFRQNRGDLYYVSFSRDGRYVAYGGSDKKITLWVVRDLAPRLPAPTLLQKSDRQSTQQETRSNFPSSSYLDADATGGDGLIEEVHDLYSDFFHSSQKSLPLPSSGFRLTPLFSARHLLHVFSRRCPPADESVPKDRTKRGFFSRRARSNASLELTTIKLNQPVPEGKVGEGEGENIDNRGSGNDLSNNRKDKGKQRDDDPSADTQSLPSDDPTPPTKLDSAENRNTWTWLMRSRGNNPTLVETAPIIECPKVVEVPPARGFQRLIVMTRKRKAKLLELIYSIPLIASNTSGSSPAGQLSQALGAPLVAAHVRGSSQPLSSSVVSVQAGPSSHLVVVNGAQYSQVTGGPSTYASPSHFFPLNYHTSHNIDSRSSIEGTCNRFLDRICFPCGHYHEDS